MIEDIGIYEILNEALYIKFINGNNYYDMYLYTNYSVHVSFWCNGSRCWNIV